MVMCLCSPFSRSHSNQLSRHRVGVGCGEGENLQIDEVLLPQTAAATKAESASTTPATITTVAVAT